MQAKMYQRYQWGRLLVILGSEAQALAVSWQVYRFTHSALSLGWTGLYLLLPGLLFFPLAGHVADRYNRRLVILCAYTAQALLTGALLWISLHPLHSVIPIYVVLFGIGTGRCFSGPASSALLPMLVAEPDLVKAVTWGATVFQIANVAGPLLGGLLFTANVMLPQRWVGAPVVYCLTLVTTVVFLCTVISIRVSDSSPQAVSWNAAAFLAGFRFVLRTQPVHGPMLLDLFAVLFGGAVALLPIFALDILHAGVSGLGLLRAMPGIGALAASFILWIRTGKVQQRPSLLIWSMTFGVATVIFAGSRWTSLSLAALFVIGASQMMSLVGRSSIIQLATPPAMRGRVSAISWVLLGTSNELGGFESGLTAHWFGAVRAVLLGGFATLAITGVAALAMPSLRRPGRRQTKPAASVTAEAELRGGLPQGLDVA